MLYDLCIYNTRFYYYCRSCDIYIYEGGKILFAQFYDVFFPPEDSLIMTQRAVADQRSVSWSGCL